MKWLALCPGCASRLPRWWFVKTKVRPCPHCSTPIKADKWSDRRFSGVVGVLVGIFVGLGIFLCMLIHPIYAIPCFIIGLAIASIIGFWLFPYFTSFEQITPTPVCPKCGYNLPIPLQRCPACGAEMSAATPWSPI